MTSGGHTNSCAVRAAHGTNVIEAFFAQDVIRCYSVPTDDGE